MSQLIHRATMLAVCVSAVTSLTCMIDTRADVIVSLPHLLVLRTFHCLLSTSILVLSQSNSLVMSAGFPVDNKKLSYRRDSA